MPLDVQGVRERVLRIGRVGQVVRDGDERGADICARWLVGKLFGPLSLSCPRADVIV